MDPSKLWDRIEIARAKLRSPEIPNDSFKRLSALWEAMPKEERDNAAKFFQLTTANAIEDSPLCMLFHCIFYGHYPPPEILIALRECWEEYLDGEGMISLESAFLGRSKQKSGNFSARFARLVAVTRIKDDFLILLGRGLSRSAAAEELHASGATKLEPETVLKVLRGYPDPSDPYAQAMLKYGESKGPLIPKVKARPARSTGRKKKARFPA